MATSNNFLSMLFAYFKDGVYNTFPLFEDLGAQQIVYIRLLNLPNEQNQLIPSFLVVAQNAKSIIPHTYYVSTIDYVSTLAVLKTQLNAISTANSFTLYTDLLSVDGVPAVGDLGGGIIVNDLYADSRKYDSVNDVTNIFVNLTQSVYATKIQVDGDQTTAGDYYVNTYLPAH